MAARHPHQPRKSTLKARDTALHVLNEVLEKDAYAALVLDCTLRDMIYLPYNLKADRDRRLATRLDIHDAGTLAGH